MNGFGILISIGKWGGVWFSSGDRYSPRIALGWIAITILPFDGDDLIHMATKDRALPNAHRIYKSSKGAANFETYGMTTTAATSEKEKS